MSEPYVGEIKIWAFAWAPRGWALCDGSVLPINQNRALFSIIGTTFGGDGTATFALPDLRGRTPVGVGTSVADGSVTYAMGNQAGAETVTLTPASVPAHSHALYAIPTAGTAPLPGGNYLGNVVTALSGGSSTNFSMYLPAPQWTADAALNAGTVSTAGASAPHANMQPFAVVNFAICIMGYYPSRS